LGKKMDFQ